MEVIEMKYNTNFFRRLKRIETDNADVDAVVHELISIIQTGELFEGEFSKFACQNWTITNEKELTDLWNSTHPDRTKKENTTSVQMKQLSDALYSLFGADVFERLDDEDTADIKFRLNAIKQQNKYIPDLFYGNPLADFNMSAEHMYEEYEVSDLKKELKALQPFLKNSRSGLDGCNKDKLGYIRKELNKPLLESRKLNEKKAEIMSALFSEIKEDTTYTEEYPSDYDGQKVSFADTTPYAVQGAPFGKIMTGMLDYAGGIGDGNIDELRYIFRTYFTFEGFAELLSHFSVADLQQVYEEYKSQATSRMKDTQRELKLGEDFDVANFMIKK